MLQKITFTTFTVSLIFLFLPVFYGRSFCESRLEGILQSGDYYSADPSGSRICFFSGYENQIEFTIINPSDASFSLYIFKYEKNKYIETVYPGKNLFQFEVNQPGLHAFEFYSEDLKEDFIIQSETTAEFKIFLILVYSAAFFSLFYFIFNLKKFKNINHFNGSKIILHGFIMFFGLYIAVLELLPVFYIGDEPHYMLMAESMIQDFDLDLTNQYSESSRSLLLRNFDPHTVITGSSSESNLISRPIHYPLLSFFLIPSFAGQVMNIYVNPVFTGKLLIIILISMLSGLLFTSFINRIQWFHVPVLFLMISGIPMLYYSNQIYPEIVAVIFISLIYFSLIKEKFFLRGLFNPVLAVLFLFLHVKYTAIAFIIMSYWNYLNIKKYKSSVLSGNIIFLIGFTLSILYNYYLYSFVGPYGKADILLENLLLKYAAYYFDADRGIFSLNPLLLYFIPGMILIFFRNKIRFGFVFILFFFLHIQNLFHKDFWLGVCPSGRYWIGAYTLISLVAFEGFIHISLFKNILKKNFVSQIVKTGWNAIALILFIISLFHFLHYLNTPSEIFTHLNPVFSFAKNINRITGYSLNHYYFSYFDPKSNIVLYFWIVHILLFFLYSFLFLRHVFYLRKLRNGS